MMTFLSSPVKNIDERVEKAVNYLAETDEPAARAKALYMGLEAQTKSVAGLCFVEAIATTVAEKEARAMMSHVYTEHLDKVKEALLDWEIYRNRRNTAEMLIEYWRSLNANRRQG